MFHGPAFAGVHEVTALAADGIRGTLRALPAPGALLDAAGQLLGHWMQLKLTGDRLVFPATLDRVRLYGPRPPRARCWRPPPGSVRWGPARYAAMWNCAAPAAAYGRGWRAGRTGASVPTNGCGR